MAGRQCESKLASPAWKLASNHWPGVFPVFKSYPISIYIDPGARVRKPFVAVLAFAAHICPVTPASIRTTSDAGK